MWAIAQSYIAQLFYTSKKKSFSKYLWGPDLDEELQNIMIK